MDIAIAIGIAITITIAIAIAYDLWANAALLGRDLLGKSTLFCLTPKVTFC